MLDKMISWADLPEVVQQSLGYGVSRAASVAEAVVTGSFSSADTRGALDIEAPDGQVTTLGRKRADDAPTPVVKVHNQVFWLRVLAFGDIGFAQSYMLHEVSSPDLTAVFEFFTHNSGRVRSLATTGLVAWVQKRVVVPSILRKTINDISTSRLNATAHYSLSNDMFEAFLSPDMTYSAPLWLPSCDPRSRTESLEAAQMRKLQYAIAATRLGEEDHVLEIGTGWGSFAMLAAGTTGCRVTTVTPSGEQKRLAEERIRAAGLEQRIEVVQADYRELDGMGPFDKVVSIEMIEHVGPEFLETYFECVDRYVKKEGGIGYFQSITIPENRYDDYVGSEDFIKKYIFPGGHLPTVSGLVRSIDRGSRGQLIVEEIKSLGPHYARALRCWKEAFLASFEESIKPALLKAHPDMSKADAAVFRRKWEYYFCYCEAGFNTKALGDVAITIARPNCIALLENQPNPEQ